MKIVKAGLTVECPGVGGGGETTSADLLERMGGGTYPVLNVRTQVPYIEYSQVSR